MRKIEGGALRKGLAGMKKEKGSRQNAKLNSKGTPLTKGGAACQKKKKDLAKAGANGGLNKVTNNVHIKYEDKLQLLGSKEDNIACSNLLKDETDPYCPDFDEVPALLPPIGRKRKSLQNNGVKKELALDHLLASFQVSQPPENGELKSIPGSFADVQNDMTAQTTDQKIPVGTGNISGGVPQEGMPNVDGVTTLKKSKKKKVKIEMASLTGSGEEIKDGEPKLKKKRKKPATENGEAAAAVVGNGELETSSSDHSPPKKKKEKSDYRMDCAKCSKTFKSEKIYTRHLKICGLNEEELIRLHPHKCTECEYRSPKKAMVARHMESHGIFKCLKCDYVGDSKEGFRHHAQELHKDRADMKLCRICSRYVKCDVITLDQHMAECKGKVPLFCPECKKEFKYESSLSVHLNSHYPDRPKRFSCDQCDYKSNYKANLQKHISCMHENRVRSVKCIECDKLFYSDESMRRHSKLHTEERLHKCEVCGQDFKTQATLKGHKELHNPARPFMCSINDCDKGFRTAKLLKKHQDEFHQMSPKRFHCRVDGCSLSFFKGSHLRRHETTHTGVRNYKCDWDGCGKAFRHADNLKIHKRQHTNEKPVKCDFCDFSCRQKSSLQWHKNKHHPEVKDSIIAEDAEFWEAVMAVVMEPEDENKKDGSELSTDVKMALLTNVKMEGLNLESGGVEKLSRKSKKKKQKDGDGTGKTIEGTSTKTLSKKKKKSIKKEGNQTEEPEQTEGTEGMSSTEIAAEAKSAKIKKKKGLKLDKVLKIKGKKKGLKKKKLKLGDNTVNTPEKAEANGDLSSPEKSPAKTPKKRGPKKKNKAKTADETINGEGQPVADMEISGLEQSLTTKTTKTKKKPGQMANSVSPNSKAMGKKGKTKKSPAEKPTKMTKKKSPKKKGEESSENKEDVMDDALREEEVGKEEKEGESPSKTKPAKKRKRGKAEDMEQDDEPKVKKARKSPAKSPAKSPVKSPAKNPAKSPAKSPAKKSPEAKKGSPKAKTRQKKLKSPAKGKQQKATKGSSKGRPKKATTKSPPKPRQKKGKKAASEAEVENKEDLDEQENSVKIELVMEKETLALSAVPPVENPKEKPVDGHNDDDIAEDSDSDLWGNNEDNNNEEERDRNCDADDERELDNDDDDLDKFSDLDFQEESHDLEKPVAAPEENPIPNNDNTSEVNNSLSDDAASLDDAIPDTPPRAPLRHNDNEEDVDENDYYEPPPSPPPRPLPPHMDSVDQRSIERQDSEQTVLDNSLPLSNNALTPQDGGAEDAMGQDVLKQPLSQEQITYVHTPQSQQPEAQDKNYFGQYLNDIPTVENQTASSAKLDPNSPNDVPEDLSNMTLSVASREHHEADIDHAGEPSDLRAEPVSTITHTRLQRETVTGLPNANVEHETVSTITHTSRTIHPVVTEPPPIPLPGMQSDVMSFQRMELLACGRQAENLVQQKESSLQRLTSITYQNFSNLDAVNPTSREMNYLRPSENMFARSCAGGGFMRVSEGDTSLGRAGMNSFLRQPDTTFARPENALTRTSNPSLLRPGGVSEDLFARDAMGRPVSRSPFHGAWTGQEIRPAHWNQTPYLQRPVERASNSTTPALPDRPEFTFDPTRSIPEQNMFSNLTSQQHELTRDTPFQLERFDLSSYFGSHPYTATPGLDYVHPTCGANQKAFEDRLRQPPAVPDLRGLPQPPSTEMLNQFCGINVNPSFNLDKYMYARDPVYRSQHVAGASESAFLSHAAPTQPTYFGRDYAGRTLYPQGTPYALMDDRQYGPGSKLTHPSGVPQDRELMARRTASNDNQIQDPYRRSVIFNVMNRSFYD